MGQKSFEVSINPKVLVWCRESIGKSVEDTAKRLSTSLKIVQDWETGAKSPTINQLKGLSKFYKRPLAVFLLAQPPIEPPFPADFRMLPADQRKPFSEKTLLAVRRARRLQRLAGELNDGRINQFNERVDVMGNPLALAKKKRLDLGIGMSEQFAFRNEREALQQWSSRVESQGVLVLQLSMPIEESRGFSLVDGAPPVIVLNVHDSLNGRIFSLFHEFAHLLLHESGICNVMSSHSPNQGIEKFCNRFSAEFLVPAGELAEQPLVKNRKGFERDKDRAVSQLASLFKVSQEVMLRRLLSLELINERYMAKRLGDFATTAATAQKKQFGKRNMSKECMSRNGKTFVSLALDMHDSGHITYYDISDYLSVKTKYIPALRELVQ